MVRWLLVIPMAGLLALMVPNSAGAQGADEATSPNPTEFATEAEALTHQQGGCDGFPWMARTACDAIGTTIGWGVENVVMGGGQAALRQIVEFVVEGASWLLGEVAAFIDRSTRPEVTAEWFRSAYRDMAVVAALGLLPFLLLAVIQSLLRQNVAMLLRAPFLHVPLAAIGTAGAVVVVDLLVQLTDELSSWIGRSFGSDLSGFATALGNALTGMSAPAGGAVAGFAALLAAALVAFAAFVVWLELLLRQAAIYVAVLFLPVGFMALVWPATSHWLRRLAEGLMAIILSKFVIVAVMALAASALDSEVAEEGFGVVISGAAMLSLAALAPYVLLRLIPVFEAGLTANLEGTFRRPTAAVGPSQVAPSRITHLLHQRLGGGSSRESTPGSPVGARSGVAAGTAQPAASKAAAAGATTLAAGAGAAKRTGASGAAQAEETVQAATRPASDTPPQARTATSSAQTRRERPPAPGVRPRQPSEEEHDGV